MLVLSLVLGLAAAVAAVGRLDGRRGDRAVPIITLVSVTISLLLPLALAVAALGASLVELTQVTALLIWLLFMVVLVAAPLIRVGQGVAGVIRLITGERSEEHTSELQSRGHIVCRLLLENKKKGGDRK